MSRKKVALMPPIAALFLLGGLYAEWQLFHLPTGDPEGYHAAVREAAKEIPYRVGSWVGIDSPVAAPAIELLKPNAIVSRTYRNLRDGRQVSLLFVHCKQARHLHGHYPPICYPAHGWVMESRRREDWKVGDLTIPGTEYKFRIKKFQSFSGIWIRNFMLLPDGVREADMVGVGTAASDPRRKLFGAGQFQIIFDESSTEEERDEVFVEFVSEMLSVIEAVNAEVGS
jgi:hypothetical protein